MASYRYRVEVPAKHIGAQINEGFAEIAVFSKPYPEDVELAKQAKEAGAKIVADICDPHFNLSHYREIVELSDVRVVPTEYMRNYLPDAHVIPDPYEFEELRAHADGDRVLWFGHRVNLKDVQKWAKMPNLRIVSGPFEETPEGITEYSPENLRKALSEDNIAFFPTSEGSEYKSPNRLLNALRMGLFPICHRHPSYTEFRDFCWVGDIREGFTWAKHNRNDLNDLVREGQRYIRDKFSPETVGEKWKDLLSSI